MLQAQQSKVSRATLVREVAVGDRVTAPAKVHEVWKINCVLLELQNYKLIHVLICSKNT